MCILKIYKKSVANYSVWKSWSKSIIRNVTIHLKSGSINLMSSQVVRKECDALQNWRPLQARPYSPEPLNAMECDLNS